MYEYCIFSANLCDVRREEDGSSRLDAKPISSEESDLQPEHVPRGAEAPGPGPASHCRPDPCHMDRVDLYVCILCNLI